MARILIVYRKRPPVEELAQRLQSAGHNVSFIGNIASALEEIAAKRPELLIVGYKFEGAKDGDFLISKFPRIPAIRISLFLDRVPFDFVGHPVRSLSNTDDIMIEIEQLLQNYYGK